MNHQHDTYQSPEQEAAHNKAIAEWAAANYTPRHKAGRKAGQTHRHNNNLKQQKIAAGGRQLLAREDPNRKPARCSPTLPLDD
jgi:hypothetical protein